MGKRGRIWTALLLSAAMTMGSISTGFASEIGESASVSADTVSEDDFAEEESDNGIDLSLVKGDENALGSETDDDTGESSDRALSDEALESSVQALSDETGEKSDRTLSDDTVESSDRILSDDTVESSVQTLSDETGEGSAQALPEENGEVSGDSVEEMVISETVSTDEAPSAEKAETGAGLLSLEDKEAELDEDSTTHTYTTKEYSKEYDGNEFTPKYTVPAGHILLSQNDIKSPVIKKENEEFQFKPIKFVSETQIYYVYPAEPAKDDDYDFVLKSTITKRPITFRSGTYTKIYDGTPLSQDSAPGAQKPRAVKGSMVGTEEFAFKFDKDAQITEPGSVKNKFAVSENGNSAEPNNYEVSYEYGDLIVAEKREKVNSLAEPVNARAIINKKGAVKLIWKKVTSYKATGKKGGKTSYKIYRYKDDGTWTKLTDGQTKTNYLDNSPAEGERMIYKIIPEGTDSSGEYGEGETPAYVRVTPKIVSVSPYDGIHYANVTFLGCGSDTDKYTLNHWNNKNKGSVDEIVNITRYNTTLSTYKLNSGRTLSSNSYLDAGGDSVTISGNNKATFSFKIKAEETTVYDYGKAIELEDSRWSKIVKLKMISMSPYLKGKRKSDTSFTLEWDTIKKATGYLVEYSKDSKFSELYTTKKYLNGRENDEYEVKDVGTGIPFYCRVTAYTKKKSDGSEYGTALGTSNVIIQYGRQKAVKKLKAEYYEDGNPRADARLTWEDDENDIKGYYVQRWSYEYNSTTKAYDKLTGHAVLQNYTASDNNTKKRYANTEGGKITNGELIKYSVQSVRLMNDRSLGENHDGYVFSEPAEFFYMNPKEVEFKKAKYNVKVDATLETSVKLKPKKLPKKFDGYKESEFKEIFLFNDDLDYGLRSESRYTSSELKKYITVNPDTGKLTGKDITKGSDIYLKVSSPNDPNNVYDEVKVAVLKNGESSGSGGGSSSSTLRVCIDAGHGGDDNGTTHNDLVEKEVNLKIAKKVGKYLEDEGAKVYYTRTDDSYVSLTKRTDIAADKDCDLFVSIHCNASDKSSSTRGTEVYYSVKSEYAKKSLSKKVCDAVADALGTNSIGAKTREGSDGDYYSVIRTSAAKGIPGIIVEHAFITNKKDAEALKDDDLIDKAAKAEAKAIYNNWK